MNQRVSPTLRTGVIPAMTREETSRANVALMRSSSANSGVNRRNMRHLLPSARGEAEQHGGMPLFEAERMRCARSVFCCWSCCF